MDHSVITFDEILNAEETKTIPKNITCKTQIFCFLLTFLIVTIALLITASIYCCLITYREKQKHLLPFHNTYNEL